MIVFKTEMKELPLNCTSCELSVDMCKLPLEILKHKNGRSKYCPLIDTDNQTIVKDHSPLNEELIIDNKEDY